MMWWDGVVVVWWWYSKSGSIDLAVIGYSCCCLGSDRSGFWSMLECQRAVSCSYTSGQARCRQAGRRQVRLQASRVEVIGAVWLDKSREIGGRRFRERTRSRRAKAVGIGVGRVVAEFVLEMFVGKAQTT